MIRMAIHVIEISIAISLTNALCRKLLGIIVVVVVVVVVVVAAMRKIY